MKQMEVAAMGDEQSKNDIAGTLREIEKHKMLEIIESSYLLGKMASK